MDSSDDGQCLTQVRMQPYSRRSERLSRILTDATQIREVSDGEEANITSGGDGPQSERQGTTIDLLYDEQHVAARRSDRTARQVANTKTQAIDKRA